jgi:hypothetical protein
MQDLRLPRIDKNRHINQQKVLVFHNDNIKYHIILSTNLLYITEFKSNCSEGKTGMVWLVNPALSTWRFVFEQIWCHGRHVHIQANNKIFGEDWLKSFATEILYAKYKKTDVAEVMKGLIHLDAHQ